MSRVRDLAEAGLIEWLCLCTRIATKLAHGARLLD